MMTVHALATRMTEISNTYPNVPVKVQGWNELGDLMDIELRGDIRIERDRYGQPVLVLR